MINRTTGKCFSKSESEWNKQKFESLTMWYWILSVTGWRVVPWRQGRVQIRCPSLKSCRQMRHCWPSSKSWDPSLTLTTGRHHNIFSGRGSAATGGRWGQIVNILSVNSCSFCAVLINGFSGCIQQLTCHVLAESFLPLVHHSGPQAATFPSFSVGGRVSPVFTLTFAKSSSFNRDS